MKISYAIALTLICLAPQLLANVLHLKPIPSAHRAVRRNIRVNPHMIHVHHRPVHVVKQSRGHRHLHDQEFEEDAGQMEDGPIEDQVEDEEQHEEGGEHFEDEEDCDDEEEPEEEEEEHEEDDHGDEEGEEECDDERTPEEIKLISLEDEEVQEELNEMKECLNEFKELIFECIEEAYTDNMMVEVEEVMVSCVGPNYEIVDRIYEKNIKQVQKIFLKIWEAKLHPLRDRYMDEIRFFEDTMDMLVNKNCKLSPTIDVVKEKAKYFVNELMFDKIVEVAREEIDCYDEINEYLKSIKIDIQNLIDQKEREKEGQMAALEENAEEIEHHEHSHEHESSPIHEEYHSEEPSPEESYESEYESYPESEESSEEGSSSGGSGSEEESEEESEEDSEPEEDEEEDEDEDEDEDEEEGGDEDEGEEGEEGEGDEGGDEGGEEAGEEGAEGEGGEEGAEDEEPPEGGEGRI